MHSPLCPSKTGPVKNDASYKSLLGPSNSSLALERMVHSSLESSGGKISQAPHAVESSSSTSPYEVLQALGVTSSCVEVIKQLDYEAKFSKVFAKVIRPSKIHSMSLPEKVA